MAMRSAVFKAGTRTVQRALRTSAAGASVARQVFAAETFDSAVSQIPLYNYVWQHLKKFANRPALTCGANGEKLSFAETHSTSLKLGSGLSKLGLQRGESVAVCLPNCVQFALLTHACVAHGFVLAPMNSSSSEGEVEHYLRLSDAAAVVVNAELAPLVAKVTARVQHVRHIICVDNPLAPGTVDFDDVIRRGNCEPPRDSDVDNVEDRMMLMFSSGTTGLPKAVELNSRCLVANLAQCLQKPYLWEDQEHERFLGVLPMYHILGLHMYLLKAPRLGAETFVLPRFNPASFVRAIVDFKPTSLHVVPPLVHFLSSEAISASDLSSLRLLLCAAAPIGPASIQQFREKTGNRVSFVQGYGMTETAPVLTLHTTDSHNPDASCGKVVPGTEISTLCVDTGKPLPLGETGQLCFRGPQVSIGYYKNEEATRALIDNEGWIHTGDVGHCDKDGNTFISDRMKELIKYKGAQVAPAHLEDVLRRHEDVADVAVLGVPHQVDGQHARAFVVPRAGRHPSAEQLVQFVDSQVARSSRLYGGVQFIDNVPRSAAGKILRRKLREEHVTNGQSNH